jgi:hypothetical protein
MKQAGQRRKQLPSGHAPVAIQHSTSDGLKKKIVSKTKRGKGHAPTATHRRTMPGLTRHLLAAAPWLISLRAREVGGTRTCRNRSRPIIGAAHSSEQVIGG